MTEGETLTKGRVQQETAGNGGEGRVDIALHFGWLRHLFYKIPYFID